MTKQQESFLIRRKLRDESRALTQQLVLGFGIGFILLAVGGYKYFISLGALDDFWYGAMWVAGMSIMATLVAPFVWRGPVAALNIFGNFVGHGVMNVILATVYFLLIWPVGAFLRATKGRGSIYSWNVIPSVAMEGWCDKKLPDDLLEPMTGSTENSRRTGILKVLVFFARSGRIIFLPALLILVSLGVALFFLQTSALAPFIYTLF